MKQNIFLGFLITAIGLGPLAASGQEKSALALSAIRPAGFVVKNLKPDQKAELNRITESLNNWLADRINGTRRFEVVGRSDLSDVISQPDLDGSGNVDLKAAVESGKLSGARYLLIATIDDFQDCVWQTTNDATGRVSTNRVFRISIAGKIYDSPSGRLLDSTSYQISGDEFRRMAEQYGVSILDGGMSEQLIVALSRSLTPQIALQITDVIYPITVLVKRDMQVTINRGEGTGVNIGGVFNVFALGSELVDPGTREPLGREEMRVGRVKVAEVDSRFSKADVLEDNGIAAGSILRRVN